MNSNLICKLDTKAFLCERLPQISVASTKLTHFSHSRLFYKNHEDSLHVLLNPWRYGYIELADVIVCSFRFSHLTAFEIWYILFCFQKLGNDKKAKASNRTSCYVVFLPKSRLKESQPYLFAGTSLSLSYYYFYNLLEVWIIT